jgi:uncharacterized protein YkwD
MPSLIVLLLAMQIAVQPKLDPFALEVRIHELINAERMKQKVPVLKLDNRLANVARLHSQDMAVRGFFDHLTPEGKTPTDRGRAAHYTCKKYFGEFVAEGLAENIFQNNLYNRVVMKGNDMTFDWNSAEKIAQTTVDGWMTSPGHRRTILTPRYQRTGIGIAISSKDQVLITQLFC